MEKLLAPHILQQSIERWTQDQIANNLLSKGAFHLLKEAFINGEFARGQAASITHYQERQARTVLSALIRKAF